MLTTTIVKFTIISTLQEGEDTILASGGEGFIDMKIIQLDMVLVSQLSIFFRLNTDVLSVGVILCCIFTPSLKFFSPPCLNLIERLSF